MEKYGSFLESYRFENLRFYYNKKWIGYYDTFANYKFAYAHEIIPFTDTELRLIKKHDIKKLDNELIFGDNIALIKTKLFLLRLTINNKVYVIKFKPIDLKTLIQHINDGLIKEIKPIKLDNEII